MVVAAGELLAVGRSMREDWRSQLFVGIHTNVQLSTVTATGISVNGRTLPTNQFLTVQVAFHHLELQLLLYHVSYHSASQSDISLFNGL